VIGLGSVRDTSLRASPPPTSPVWHKSASLPSVVVKHYGSRALRRLTGIQLRTVLPAEATPGAPVAEASGEPKLMRPSKEATAQARLSIREHRARARLVFGDIGELFAYVKPKTTPTTIQLKATACISAHWRITSR